MEMKAIEDMHKFYSDSYDAVLEDLAKNKEEIMRMMFLKKTTGAEITISFEPMELVHWYFATTHCSFKETKNPDRTETKIIKETKLKREVNNGKEEKKGL